MDPNVTVALIALVGTIVSGVVGIVSSQKVIGVRIDELTKRVEKHNQVVERTFRLETQVELIKANIDEIEDQIHNLSNK